MSQCSITCDLHDYLEIACMYQYQVRLVLKDGSSLVGKAIDTVTKDKREYLLIDDSGETRSVELIQLKKLEVLTANAQFKPESRYFC